MTKLGLTRGLMRPMAIELRSIPGCPNVDAVRQDLRRVLAELRIDAAIHEVVGDHPSPTVLVDGVDVVTGAAPASAAACCRLDLPTYLQLRDALCGAGSVREGGT